MKLNVEGALMPRLSHESLREGHETNSKVRGEARLRSHYFQRVQSITKYYEFKAVDGRRALQIYR